MPSDLTMRLYQPDESKARQRVILVTTTDEDGWPRHFMLSHYEVVAKDPSHLLLLTYVESKSTQNLLRRGKASLLFLDEEMSYYVRIKCTKTDQKIKEAPQELLFAAEVSEVLEDKYPTTKITSGIKFTGFDPGMSEANRKLVFEKLTELATQRTNQV